MSFNLVNGTWKFSLRVHALDTHIDTARLFYDGVVKHLKTNGYAPFKFTVVRSDIVQGAFHIREEEYEVVDVSKINGRFSKKDIFSAPAQRTNSEVRVRGQSPLLQVLMHGDLTWGLLFPSVCRGIQQSRKQHGL